MLVSTAVHVPNPYQTSTTTINTIIMACGSSHATLVNRNGPGSAASSTIESIINKPADGSGKTKCIECDGYECCCIPIPCTVM
ncbi:hypothetical protein PG991_015258 [Apiospora marii]|uniref:Uncharacterized protein n=2 Tax=Apiospora TaxID=1811811 RepID=A0ABR1R1A4_9PEZI